MNKNVLKHILIASSFLSKLERCPHFQNQDPYIRAVNKSSYNLNGPVVSLELTDESLSRKTIHWSGGMQSSSESQGYLTHRVVVVQNFVVVFDFDVVVAGAGVDDPPAVEEAAAVDDGAPVELWQLINPTRTLETDKSTTNLPDIFDSISNGTGCVINFNKIKMTSINDVPLTHSK